MHKPPILQHDGYDGHTNPYYLMLLPILFAAVLILLYSWMKPGFLGSDDMAYARLAYDVLAGRFYLDAHHFTNRLGMYFPTAIGYAFFGVNDYTTTAWSLLSAVITVVAIFHITYRMINLLTAVLSSFLFVLNPILLGQISVLLPDLPVGMFIFLAAVSLLIARRSNKQSEKLSFAALFCILVALAILTKETSVWIVYFAAIILVLDVVLRQNLAMWIWIFVGGLAVGCIYLLFYFFVTGDALFRLKGIEGGHNLSLWSYSAGKAGSLFYRLTFGPLELLIQERGLLLPLALSIPPFLLVGACDDRQSSTARYFSLLGVSLVLSYWFGTTSLSSYNPLPLFPRMLTPIIAPLIVASAFTIYRLYFCNLQSPRQHFVWGVVPAIALIAGGIYSYLFLENIARLYFVSAFLLAVPFLSRFTPATVRSILIPFCGLLLLTGIAYFTIQHVAKGEFGETPRQKAERAVIQYMLSKLPQDAVLVTSQQATWIIEYYNRFETIQNPAIHIWGVDSEPHLVPQRPFFVYFDALRESWLVEESGDASFQQFVANSSIEWEEVTQDRGIQLFLTEYSE